MAPLPTRCGPDGDAIARVAQIFDIASTISPEAGVALYSLGNPHLLVAATAEIVRMIGEWRLADESSCVLEIGCGAGRFLAGLGPFVRMMIGIDISEGMLRAAREKIEGSPSTIALRVSGANLDLFREQVFDLVLAIDSFPYIVSEDKAPACFADCARVLKPGGRMLIMNFDYSGDGAGERENVAELAQQSGFSILRNGTCDLATWDGRTFLLQKSATGPEAAT